MIHKIYNEAFKNIRFTSRQMAKDLRFFRRYYFKHCNSLPDAPMHGEITNILAEASVRRGVKIALAAPRDSGKSTLINHQYVLYCICNKLEHFIVVMSNTASQATDILTNIKSELETNPFLIRDFPEVCEIGQKPSPKRWKINDITTRNDIKVIALSPNQQIRGRRYNQYRPTLIILDDVESNDDAKNQESFDTAYDWMTKAVLKAGGISANVIFMGTIHHYNSLLAQFIDPKSNTGWIKLFYRSIISPSVHPELWEQWIKIYNRQEEYNDKEGPSAGEEFFLANKEPMLEGTKVLWPEKHDYYTLMKKREDEGPISFDSEYQNEPINPRDCTFSPSERHYWTDRFNSEEELLNMLKGKSVIIGSCDPSLGRESRKGDYSAIITVAIDTDTRTIYLLDADIERRSPDKTIEDIIAHHKRRKYERFGFETNQFQEFMAIELQKRASAAGNFLNVEEIKHTSDKVARIQSLQPMVKNGTLQFSKKHQTLLEQMKYFPKGNHDDGLDALQMTVKLCQDATDKIGITFIRFNPFTEESEMIAF